MNIWLRTLAPPTAGLRERQAENSANLPEEELEPQVREKNRASETWDRKSRAQEPDTSPRREPSPSSAAGQDRSARRV